MCQAPYSYIHTTRDAFFSPPKNTDSDPELSTPTKFSSMCIIEYLLHLFM